MKIDLIVAASILLSCSPTAKEMSGNTDSTGVKSLTADTDFLNAVSMLPKLTLPFEVSCQECCDVPKFDRSNALVSKYFPEKPYTGVIGVIEANERYVCLLTYFMGDGIIPVVEVYSVTGKLLGKQSFMTLGCGQEADYLENQYFRIGADLSLCDIDSVYYFEMDGTYDHILDTTKTFFKETTYGIDDKGLILKKASREMIDTVFHISADICQKSWRDRKIACHS